TVRARSCSAQRRLRPKQSPSRTILTRDPQRVRLSRRRRRIGRTVWPEALKVARSMARSLKGTARPSIGTPARDIILPTSRLAKKRPAPHPRTALMPSPDTPLTQLLQLAAAGERGALERVFAALYPDLRRMAAARLASQGGVAHLQTTVLVHESFIRLVERAELTLTDRKHFFSYAAKTMRNIIIDFAREHLAQRRGGGRVAVPLDTAVASELLAQDSHASVIAINDALQALETVDPELAQLVEMRYFAGYSEEEIADLTGSSQRTVRRQWQKARAFLLATLQK